MAGHIGVEPGHGMFQLLSQHNKPLLGINQWFYYAHGFCNLTFGQGLGRVVFLDLMVYKAVCRDTRWLRVTWGLAWSPWEVSSLTCLVVMFWLLVKTSTGLPTATWPLPVAWFSNHESLRVAGLLTWWLNLDGPTSKCRSGQDRSYIAFYDLAWEVTQHPFCYTLLFKAIAYVWGVGT